MDFLLLLKALVMGIVEGITEFLPISSTGHLIIASSIVQFPDNIATTFAIFIQLGAILAVIVYFIRDLIDLLRRAPSDPGARRLILGVAIAFVPAGAIGYLISDLLDAYLFKPFIVGVTMVVGALIILLVESRQREPTATSLDQVSLRQALVVGIAQIASLIPGMSRSASTIVGGLLAGMDRPTTVRFSFYLSIPTLVIASLFYLARNFSDIQASQLPAFGIGLVASFIVALAVVHWFLGFVSRYTLRPFAWYRLAAGVIVMLVYLPRPV